MLKNKGKWFVMYGRGFGFAFGLTVSLGTGLVSISGHFGPWFFEAGRDADLDSFI